MGNKAIVQSGSEMKIPSLNIHRLNTSQGFVEEYTTPDSRNFEILWIQHGAGIHTIDGMQFPFGNNTIFCGEPGQWHQLKMDTDFSGYVILFTESFLFHGNDDEYGIDDSEFSVLFSKFSRLQIEMDIADEMNGIVSTMMKESNRDLSLKMELLSRYLKIFLIYAVRQFELRQPSTALFNNGLMKKFIAAVNKEFRIKKLVKEYADLLSVTTNHLNQSVKRASGNSAGYHIRQRIIKEAKRKAVYSDRNMKEIAYDLGFEAPAHFSKFFKNYAGINFSSFKRFEPPFSTSS